MYRVLIVDDEPIICEGLRKSVRWADFNCEGAGTASNGLEGLEKGPAGNTSLAAAFALSQTLPQDQCIVVQETEYTGAGKHVNAQLSFARSNGIEIRLGNPEDEIPGRSIILPEHPRLIKAREADMSHLRHSLIKHAVGTLPEVSRDSEGHPVLDEQDVEFLALETNSSKEFVLQALKNL